MCAQNVPAVQIRFLLVLVLCFVNAVKDTVADDKDSEDRSAFIVNPSQFVFMALKYREKTMPSWEKDAESGEKQRKESEFLLSNEEAALMKQSEILPWRRKVDKKKILKAYECAVLSRPQSFRSKVDIKFTECGYSRDKKLSEGYTTKKYVYTARNEKTEVKTLEKCGYKGTRYNYTNNEDETVREVVIITDRGKSKSKCCLFSMASDDGDVTFAHFVPFEADLKHMANSDKSKAERYMAHRGVALLPTDRDNSVRFKGFHVTAEEYSLKAENKKVAQSRIFPALTELALAPRKRLQSQESYKNSFLCEVYKSVAGFKAVSVDVVSCTKRHLTLSGRKKPSFDHAMLDAQGDLVGKYLSTTIGTVERLLFGTFCCQFKLVERKAAHKRLPLELRALRMIKVQPKSKSVTEPKRTAAEISLPMTGA